MGYTAPLTGCFCLNFYRKLLSWCLCCCHTIPNRNRRFSSWKLGNKKQHNVLREVGTRGRSIHCWQANSNTFKIKCISYFLFLSKSSATVCRFLFNSILGVRLDFFVEGMTQGSCLYLPKTRRYNTHIHAPGEILIRSHSFVTVHDRANTEYRFYSRHCFLIFLGGKIEKLKAV
jgi:hypothetical protein